MSRSRRTRNEPLPIPRQPGATDGLRQALGRRKKAELIEALIALAADDPGVLRRLNARFDVEPPPEELVTQTRRAIHDATAYDPRQINRNFHFDSGAYAEVERNLGRLIASGQWHQALALALELMKRGSEQVEMSDEGMMTSDIEACLKVVIDGLAGSDLPAQEVLAWCAAMRDSDRVKFIAKEPLEALRQRAEAASSL